ncbi:hypothetical protein [Burkholderia territorii]|uniref:hypothetical protein n=1 Tax=Burkholderia territorii TaxID=1503055 RepID=UPI001E3255E1|nr:hypothetical protein [Burkholderia territorii]
MLPRTTNAFTSNVCGADDPDAGAFAAGVAAATCARTPDATHSPPASTAQARHRHFSRHRSRDLRSTLGGMRHSPLLFRIAGRPRCTSGRPAIKCLFHFDDDLFAILIMVRVMRFLDLHHRYPSLRSMHRSRVRRHAAITEALFGQA